MNRSSFFIVILLIALVDWAYIGAYSVYLSKKDGAEPQGRYRALLGVNAKETRFVDVTGCVLRPDVISVREGSTVTFVNNDKSAHVLDFSKKAYRIAPNNTLDVTFDFYNIPGTRKYDCDENEGAGLVSIFFKVSSYTPDIATSTEKEI